MATFDFGDLSAPDTLALFFYQDAAGSEPARVNFGVLPDGQYVGNTAEWQPVASADAAAPDVFRIHVDLPQSSAAYFSFINDLFGPEGDRNVHLLKAEINGNEIAGSHIDASSNGDFLIPFFNGDAVAPDPDPPPPPPPPPEPGRTITGTAGSDNLAGGSGPDTISGLGGDDFLYGEAGDDVLRGGAGSDWLDVGPGATQTIVSNSGRDDASFRHGYGAVTWTDFAVGFDSVIVSEADAHLRITSHGSVSGTEITFDTDPSVLWLPGVSVLGEATVFI